MQRGSKIVPTGRRYRKLVRNKTADMVLSIVVGSIVRWLTSTQRSPAQTSVMRVLK